MREVRLAVAPDERRQPRTVARRGGWRSMLGGILSAVGRRRPPAEAPAAPASASSPPRGRVATRGTPPAHRRRGPGLSKLGFRVSRAWSNPRLRAALLGYLPLLLLALAGWRLAAEDAVRTRIVATVQGAAERLAARPEFAVRGVEVQGADAALRALVRETAAVAPGASSLTLDLGALRRKIEALGPVKSARVRFDPSGTLLVEVVARMPAALFRRPDGTLVVIDGGGVEIGPAGSRAAHPDLPVLLGAGAPASVQEALAILEEAPELRPRLRAMVRVGERRWDLFLAGDPDGDVVIRLPETGVLDALARLREMDARAQLLARDIAVVDLRLPERPTIRPTERARERMELERSLATKDGRDT